MQRRWWSPIFAALLLLQWSAAFGHCRVIERASIAAFSICSTHPEGSRALDQHEPNADADWDCPACHQVPFVESIAPSVAVVSVRGWFFLDVPPPLERRETLGPRAPPPPPRAPPTA